MAHYFNYENPKPRCVIFLSRNTLFFDTNGNNLTSHFLSKYESSDYLHTVLRKNSN